MPELKNCRKCKRIFPYIAGMQICESCRREEEKLFEKVWEFLRDNPGTSMPEVAEELDVPYEQLMKYVREGRIQVKAPDGRLIMFCERCGDIIKSGRICDKCEGGLTREFQSVAKDMQGRVSRTPSRGLDSKSETGFVRQNKERNI